MVHDTFMGRSIYPAGRQKKILHGMRVYPIKPGHMRMQMPGLSGVLGAFKDLVGQSQEIFSACYAALLCRYADFVQFIPEQLGCPEQLMLSRSIKYSYILTQAYLEQLKVVEKEKFYQTDQGARLIYAVFSSALLFRIARCIADKQIIICDQRGKFVCYWPFFSQEMAALGAYFKIRQTKILPETVVAQITHILARQIMPDFAFEWIAQDKGLLARWLRALNFSDETFGVPDINLDLEVLLRQSDFLCTATLDSVVTTDYQEGEAFWDWLTEKMDALTTPATLQEHSFAVIGDRLFLDIDALIGQYVKIRSIDAVSVREQLKALGVMNCKDNDFKYHKVYTQSQESSSSIGASGLYARAPARMDASRVVGVDAQVARTCIQNYNGLSNQSNLLVDVDDQSLYQRLLGSFLGKLINSADLESQSGRA